MWRERRHNTAVSLEAVFPELTETDTLASCSLTITVCWSSRCQSCSLMFQWLKRFYTLERFPNHHMEMLCIQAWQLKIGFKFKDVHFTTQLISLYSYWMTHSWEDQSKISPFLFSLDFKHLRTFINERGTAENWNRAHTGTETVSNG